MRTVTKLVAIFLLLHILGGVHSSIHDGFAKVFGTVGSVTNVRTTRLLNQLCNESQDDNSLERDACYGCFFRATTQPSGYPTLLAMATCADVYLNNTDYGHCRVYLRDATNNMDPRASPTIIYCTFLECIRQVNKDSLDALESLTREAAPWSPDAKYAWKKRSHFLSLRKNLSALRGICVVRDENRPGFPNNNGPDPDPIPRRYSYSGEALTMFSNFSSTDVRLAQLFVNTTACILAKTRCGVPNPITGDYQEVNGISSKLGMTGVNALYVNSYYDINIMQLPFGNGVIDECAKYRNAQQATWPTVQCIPTSGF